MTLRQATPSDSALIRNLAIPAWETAYSDILPEEQFTYMIEKTYSDDAINRQMQDGHVFFIVYLAGNEPAGFMSLSHETEGIYVLEKLYVLPSVHGTGAGRFLVGKAEEYIRTLHPGKNILLELNVNRKNKAVGFYERVGFHIDRTVDEYIGNGFYKNDYIMQKTVKG